MPEQLNLHEYLSDIADALRVKKGSVDPINAQDFAQEILDLETIIEVPTEEDLPDDVPDGTIAVIVGE